MSYQDSILKKYKEAFPDQTLKFIAEETGIQMTRIFRLFNGAEMKLKEYEAFETSLRKNSMTLPKLRLLEKFQACMDVMPEQNLRLFEVEINHLLKVDNIVNKPFFENASYPAAL